MSSQNEPCFQNELLLKGTRLVGWSEIMHNLDIQLPLRQLSCLSEKYVRGTRRTDGAWIVYDKRYTPDNTLLGHLSFALRYENSLLEPSLEIRGWCFSELNGGIQ